TGRDGTAATAARFPLGRQAGARPRTGAVLPRQGRDVPGGVAAQLFAGSFPCRLPALFSRRSTTSRIAYATAVTRTADVARPSPAVIPTAAVSQMAAAVVSPWTRFSSVSFRMQPAPRNPMPAGSPWTPRLG